MMMANQNDVSVALVGIGGYGNIYLASLLDASLVDPSQVGQSPRTGTPSAKPRLIAAVDPKPESCKYLVQLNELKIPIYKTLAELRARHSPDLVILCSPPHVHCEQTLEALAGGSHVLCEKPLCTTPQQALEMIEARERANKHVSIGYQWSFSPAIQALKRDVLAGLFGKPKCMRTIVLWPRETSYYSRNNWAGRRYSASGKPLFDSPLNNACAHHLHNMFYVLGDRLDLSAIPATVKAELYRANDIETFDTCAVRIMTREDVEILYIASHATREANGPLFSFEFEEATIALVGDQPTALSVDGGGVYAHFRDGRVKEYGSPESDPQRKLWAAVESVRTNEPTVCGIEASMAQTMVMAATHESVADAATFPAAMVLDGVEPGRERKWVEGLDQVLMASYEQGRLPHEMSVPWAVAGDEIRVADPRVADPLIQSVEAASTDAAPLRVSGRTPVTSF